MGEKELRGQREFNEGSGSQPGRRSPRGRVTVAGGLHPGLGGERRAGSRGNPVRADAGDRPRPGSRVRRERPSCRAASRTVPGAQVPSPLPSPSRLRRRRPRAAPAGGQREEEGASHGAVHSCRPRAAPSQEGRLAGRLQQKPRVTSAARWKRV